MQKTSLVYKKESVRSFSSWSAENARFIEYELLNAGIDFLLEHAQNLKTSLTHLLLDDKWHYLDKPKKESYRARIEINNNGTPWLHLVYYTFKSGGYSVKFDGRAMLKSLWLKNKNASSLIPVSVYKNPNLIKPAVRTKPIVPTINYIERDEALWDELSTEGVSHYLNRKGFKETFIKGVRYSKLFVAVALINPEHDFFGLQKIYNDGKKLFTKGLIKKGHFALIGVDALPEKVSRIHICEGVATAMSVFVATGELVISAMDAFNLLPVGKSLKKHYKKAELIFWADNDWQKQDKINPQGRALGNTGLIQANHAAFKLRNALVCTPDFSTLDETQKQSATDFNDLHQLKDIKALEETKPQKVDLALALWHEIIKNKKRAHGVVTPSQFQSGEKVTYVDRYLPKDMFKREGVHLVRSAIGTGKTEVVEKFVKKNKKSSVLFTTHLISLVESGAKRLGLTSYNECDFFDLQIENRLAICLNSLGKLTREGPLPHFDIVVIDEIEQMLSRLTTHIDQKPLIFSVLKQIIENATTVLCLDAHLSHVSVDLIKRLVTHKNVTIHFNEYEAGRKKDLLLHETPESLQMSALKALGNKKKVYLAFNAKKEAYKTFCTMKATFPNKKGLYISSDNTGDKANIAFFKNVNVESKKYDYLICTPSVSTGVSIDNGHFDFVGGVFNAQINTANDCMQALGRVRNHNLWHVFCDKRRGTKPLDAKTISAKWINTHYYDLNLMSLNDTGEQILLNPTYEAITILVTQNKNRSHNDFYEQFALLALEDGVSFSYVEEVLEKSDIKILRDFKVVATDKAHQDYNQLDLSAEELTKLSDKPRKTMQETQTYKKKQLLDFYRLNDTETTTLTQLTDIDADGRFRKKITLLELALGDVQLAKQRFTAQFENQAQFAADLTYHASTQVLYKKLLHTLKAIDEKGALVSNEYHYNNEALISSGFIDWIEVNRASLNGVINIPNRTFLNAEPLRFVSTLLSQMGMKQKRVGQSTKGTYVLCAENLAFLKAILNKRQAPQLSAPIPEIETKASKLKNPSFDVFKECFNKVKAFFNNAGVLEPVTP